jgi:hypothetical protein
MHEPIILQQLTALEGAARRAGVPAVLAERLAQVRRRSELLARLRGRLAPGYEPPPAEAPERLLTLPEIPDRFADIVAEADTRRADAVLRDYLRSRAAHVQQLASDPDQRRARPRQDTDQRVVLASEAGRVAGICRDRSPQGFGLWAAEAPGLAIDAVVRVLLDDPVGYECFMAHRTDLPEGGVHIGLEFPGDIEAWVS